MAVIGSWLLFIAARYYVSIRQKSILRYQIEQELGRLAVLCRFAAAGCSKLLFHARYLGRNLEPESEEEKEEEKLGFENNGFNQFRSDRIALDRELPDTRDPR